jgi:Protein of unknown function (DUF1559)
MRCAAWHETQASIHCHCIVENLNVLNNWFWAARRLTTAICIMKRSTFVLRLFCVVLVAILSILAYGVFRERADENTCRQNLKVISGALMNYYSKNGAFPPAFVADNNGRPLHSWRVLLLPYLGEDALFKAYRFDEPWDGPHNRLLADRIPVHYKCPSDSASPFTTSYCIITDNDGRWLIGNSTKSDAYEENPIFVAEVADSGILWLEPRDLKKEQALAGINSPNRPAISSNHKGGAHVEFKYASPKFGEFTTFLPNATPREELRSLMPNLSAVSEPQK